MPTKISKNIHKETRKCYGVDGPPYRYKNSLIDFYTRLKSLYCTRDFSLVHFRPFPVCICAFLEDWCGYAQTAAQSVKNTDTTMTSNDFLKITRYSFKHCFIEIMMKTKIIHIFYLKMV